MLSSLLSKSLTPPREDADACLHTLFEAQVERTPGAPALLVNGHSLTYAHLNRQANRLAHYLCERGVGPETLVGICADSGREMIVGLLAILKSGGAYLPLDPTYPGERLSFMLSDAGVEFVLTQSHLQAGLPESYAPVMICLDTDSYQWLSESPNNFESGATPDNLAYVIYTSGSTGHPKGVLLEHRSICNNIRWRQDSFPLTAEDRILQTYSFSFDPSVWAMFWPLAAGATLVMPKPGIMADTDYVVQMLADKEITVAGFGPAMLQNLLAHPDISRCTSLRLVFCGGEAMPLDLPSNFYSRLNACLCNIYGPTEATIDASCWIVPESCDGAIPIGFPIANTELFVLNQDMREVRDGEEGELYIAGAGLARGYLNRPEMTEEFFLPHPFKQAPNERVYRTGDLAQRGRNGEIYYLGRIDSQVKLRGFRIELGEIEAALGNHPGILEAVVTLREDNPGDKRLVAYIVSSGIVSSGESALSAAQLRRFLSARLPPHMVPAAFVFLEALPLTINGKQDRRALPPPGRETWERGADYIAPQDPLQRQLTQIWEDLLEIRPIGIRDSFWEIGGHSLLAARMLEQITEVCGRTISLGTLYEGGTVETLAAFLQSHEEAVSSPLAKIAPGGTRRPFFFLYGFLPLGGFYCYHLARHFSPEQPFYALHPPTASLQGSTLERMATNYIAIMREKQPEGPYRLGGYCGSGLVAYEIARQLAEQGQEVEFLALIEVHAVNANFRLWLRQLSGSQHRFIQLQAPLLPIYSILQSRWRRWKDRHEAPKPAQLEACDRAAGAYVPRPYAGPVTLIRSENDPEPFTGDPIALWRETAPALTIHSVPGDHLSCLLEHVGGLGDCLGRGLDALEVER